MAKKKVFVSYDHSEDAHYKRLLQAWDANPDFDFEFDSRGEDYLRALEYGMPSHPEAVEVRMSRSTAQPRRQ